ncbi:CASP-like protein 5C3 [Impatiens glandulifera]|uniref:CASP-like protein 5C3 n=1 Tax=Impatiens glandulifera TaxID=253017 RepID=UPI001FB174F6|nr:CASP-like protein 5C3 [Impatiens glandulifera]
MDELPGSFGTSASLALRLGQTVFSIASLLFMCLDIQFYSYTSFSFLVIVMGFVSPWSMILAMLDVYLIFFKSPYNYHQQGRRSLIFIVAADWILCLLSLAAAASTASVIDFLIVSKSSFCGEGKLCSRYQLSAAMSFLSWFLSLGSSLFNLWLLPSL